MVKHSNHCNTKYDYSQTNSWNLKSSSPPERWMATRNKRTRQFTTALRNLPLKLRLIHTYTYTLFSSFKVFKGGKDWPNEQGQEFSRENSRRLRSWLSALFTIIRNACTDTVCFFFQSTNYTSCLSSLISEHRAEKTIITLLNTFKLINTKQS